MVNINYNEVKREILFFLRNSEILSNEVRGVETELIEEPVTNISTYTIPEIVKNIREIRLNNDLLTYGKHYTYKVKNYAQITFKTAITGDLKITYDVGQDKIWGDFPRDDLSISNYPRVAVDIISNPTNPYGIGGKDDLSEILFSIVAYAEKQEDVEDILSKVRKAIMNNKKNFSFSPFVTISGSGRLINSEYSQIVFKNIDFIAKFILEEADDN